MKVKKLNARGFSHDIMIVLFVVLFAIGGVAYLVASHADSCPTTWPMSGPTKGQNCPTPVGFCRINSVPAKPKVGDVITPTITVYNTGKVGFKPNIYQGISIFNVNGVITRDDSQLVNASAVLRPGESQKINFVGPTFITPVATRQIHSGQYTINSLGAPYFYCNASFALPTASQASGAPTVPLDAGIDSIDTDGVGASHGDPFHLASTSYASGKLNSDKTNYVGVSSLWAANNSLKAGNVVTVQYGGKTVYAVLGDFSGKTNKPHPQVSVHLAAAFGICAQHCELPTKGVHYAFYPSPSNPLGGTTDQFNVDVIGASVAGNVVGR